VPAYSDPGDVTVGRTLEMPFVEQRASWRAPDGRLLLTRGTEADSDAAQQG
jgi:hypothetical protein